MNMTAAEIEAKQELWHELHDDPIQKVLDRLHDEMLEKLRQDMAEAIKGAPPAKDQAAIEHVGKELGFL